MKVSTERRPRGAIRVNGQWVLWRSWEINNNSFYHADTFTVSLPISGQAEGVDLQYWAGVVSLEVEIFAGFPSDPSQLVLSNMQSLILGNVDDIAIDMVSNTIELTGRDYTSKLIDSKTTNKWQNMKSSDIAIMMAKDAGLTPVVTSTTGKAGKFYNIDHAKLESKATRWDLLCGLAYEEGYQVYVRGNSLHFEPKASDPNSNPYILQWDTLSDEYPNFDGKSLKFNRNLTLSRDVIVHVHSWNFKTPKGFIETTKVERSKDPVTKKANRSGPSIPIGDPQVYSFVIPNLTHEQALVRARNFLATITQHEMRMAADLPGDNDLTPNRPIKIIGTGAYDQVYFADNVVRKMSVEDGYTMSVSAKNHNTDSYKVA